MATQETKTAMKQANETLLHAQNELNRPSEDVVALSVCFSARKAMNEMMRLYLNGKSKTSNENESLSELFNKCKLVQKNFEKINIEPVMCNNMNMDKCNAKYCLSLNHISDCVKIAAQIKGVIIDDMMISSRELE